MKTEFMTEPGSKAIWLLLAFALAIRVWGVDYGLPFIYWTDEYHEVMRALELGAGEFNLARTGKGGFYLVLLFEYGVYYFLLKMAGLITTTQAFAQEFVRDPTPFYLMGRATAALIGCATVAAVYLLARKAYRAEAGLLAALFLAVNVLHVDLSHRVGVDIPMTFGATMALYFAMRVAAEGRVRDYLLAGLFAALATTTKLPGILLVAPLLAAHMYRVVDSPAGRLQVVTSRELWMAVAVFALVLVVTNPGILLHANFLTLYSTPTDGVLDEDALAAAADLGVNGRPNLHVFYLDVLRASMGWPLFVFSLGSVVHAAWKHRPPDVILLVYAALNYVAITSTTSEVLYYPRYTLPIVVVLVVLAGRALSDIVQIVPRQRFAVAIILAGVMTAWPLAQSVRQSHVLTQVDTRTVAKEWFDAHVPSGRKVLIEGGKVAPLRLTVPLADSQKTIDRRIAYWKTREPRQASFLRHKRAAHEGGGYELEFVRVASIAPMEEYLAREIEYFVVRPETFVGARKADSGSANLLKALRSDARITLLKRFEPASVQPGPTIEIYRFQPDAASTK